MINEQDLWDSSFLRQMFDATDYAERFDNYYAYVEGGKRHLDWLVGIGVNSFGHGNPNIRKALNEQLDKGMGIISATYRTREGEAAAEKIANLFMPDSKIIAKNDGAHANEAAFRAMHFYHKRLGQTNRDIIITFKDAFHGRTITTQAAASTTGDYWTANSNFANVSFNDVADLRSAVEKYGERLIGIFGEVLQGEGGCNVATPEFVHECRILADQHKALFGVDEVQSGMGRSGGGKIWAHEHYSLEDKPDLITTAKALSGGIIPISALILSPKIVEVITNRENKLAYGDGSTYGGNPVAMAVASAAIDELRKPQFSGPEADANCTLLRKRLNRFMQLYPDLVKDEKKSREGDEQLGVGRGWMIGFDLTENLTNLTFMKRLRENGLTTWTTSMPHRLRMLPPLHTGPMQIEEGLDIMNETLHQISRELNNGKSRSAA